MKIEGAVAELDEHTSWDDFCRHKGNQPGPAEQIGIHGGELGGDADRDHGQKRVMPAQGERQDGLLSRARQQKDRVEHRVSRSPGPA
jgi:hypothetical protein